MTYEEYENIKSQISKLKYKPKISIVMPVYNVESKWLIRCLGSIMNQLYDNWELCICDDGSTNPHTKRILDNLIYINSQKFKVITHKKNSGIAAATNSALDLVDGEFISLIDSDDEIEDDTLFEVVKVLNKYPSVDMIYTDEDKIDILGRRYDSFHKPDWSPEYFLSAMFTCHFGTYRSSIAKKVRFRSMCDFSQDWDFVLRLTKETNKIYHIPKILYHWRALPTSTAKDHNAKPLSHVNAKVAIQDYLKDKGNVSDGPGIGLYRVDYVIKDKPKISIVIPSRFKKQLTHGIEVYLLDKCIKSIDNSTYRNYEIIVVSSKEHPNDIKHIINFNKVKHCFYEGKFNFSESVNIGVANSTGEYVVLMNDDIELLTPEWIENMLGFAQQKEIGSVGAKLYFPNGNLQHCGAVIVGGVPMHVGYGYPKNDWGYFYSNVVIKNVSTVTAALLMVAKKKFQEVGGFDEKLPNNYNDTDFGLCLLERGYRNVYTPYVEAFHHESISIVKDQSVFEKDMKLFKDKWGEYVDPYYNLNLSQKKAFELNK
jgi:glycosyltransferase involved in cell wall biosynthesis